MWLVGLVSPSEFLPWGAALSSRVLSDPSLLSILGVFIYPFLHADILHLILNSIVFASLGSLLESTITRRLFIRVLATAALAPACIWLLSTLAIQSTTVVIGSSGLVYALFGACLVLFPEMPLNLIFIEIKLWMAASALIAFSFLATIAQCFGYQSGTAHLVHFGGAVCGWVLLGGYQRFTFNSLTPFRWLRERAAQTEARKAKQNAARVDDILAKVSRSGIASLTASERKYLEQQSRKK